MTRQLLVIDDEQVVREAVVDILDSVGIGVLQASNGREGLELFLEQREAIGMVLLDMKMPGWSGLETLRHLRQHAPHMPVLLSSGYSEEEARRGLEDDRHVDFLPKPYDFDALIAKVEAVLRASA